MYPGHENEEDHVSKVMDIHFDEENGTPYWLEGEEDWDFDPREDVTSYEDLDLFPEADEKDLIYRPFEDFIPESIDKTDYIVAESSGTTGEKKQIPWLKKVSDEIINWYDTNLDMLDFPEDENWMSIGPYGLYEKHMNEVANRRGGLFYPVCIETRNLKNRMKSAEEFMENKWKLWELPGALKMKSSMEPTMKTVKEKLGTEDIGVITSAPQILNRIAGEGYTDFEGVLVSGTGFNEKVYRELDEKFPHAEVEAMYATSFWGPAFDHPGNDSYAPEYFTPEIVDIDIVDLETKEPVDYGERGQVVFHRIDEGFFWPNQLERDSAIKTEERESYSSIGLKDVGPLDLV